MQGKEKTYCCSHEQVTLKTMTRITGVPKCFPCIPPTCSTTRVTDTKSMHETGETFLEDKNVLPV